MSTYVLAQTVRDRLGSRITKALDRNGDGVEDVGLLADLIAEAGDEINMRLAQRLETPFAEITATPATPPEIQRIALWIVLSEIAAWSDPNSQDAIVPREKANATLTALAEGKADIPSQRRTSGLASGIGASYEGSAPVFGGLTSADVSRLRGV